MSAFESSHKSLLQGVSQQIARERQPGQVTAQENMLSDVVTNVRRRPGAEYRFSLDSPSATYANIKAIYTNISGQDVHVFINTTTGTLNVLSSAYAVLATTTSAYLAASSPKSIQMTTVGSELFILNREKVPVSAGTAGGVSPNWRGMFFVSAGAFSKEYTVTIRTNLGAITGTYTTPNGATIGDAAMSTPAAIATGLAASLNPRMNSIGVQECFTLEAYVYIHSTSAATTVTVTSSVGSAYMIVSRDSYFTVEGNLPAQLPPQADGWIVRVGDMRSPKYYTFDSSRSAWLESGDYDAPIGLLNMPVSVVKIGATWTLDSSAFEGRLAGDEDSNPDPVFMTDGITGIGSYQGRLVLLSRAQVLLSASNKPRRFYRSTIAAVLDNDTIAVGASANLGAEYEYAIPFQKDLLLFSAKYQALIPSGNSAISPRTATCVLTSDNSADMGCAPLSLGRTLMYPAPRSEDYFGVMEMVPSPNVDSQYVSSDSTSHLPKYMAGRCRFSTCSSTAGMALFASTGDTKSLLVHEYMWNGDTKAQQAWHRWTFPYPVAAAYFASEMIHIVFVNSGKLMGCSIDPRVGVLTFNTGRKPFLDLHGLVTISNNSVSIPAWLSTFDPAIASKLAMTVRSGDLVGERVGASVVDANTLQTVLSYTSGDVSIGVPYTSALSPTPPTVKDANEVVISTAKTTLLRYAVSTTNSSEFKVAIRDAYSVPADGASIGTLYWSSTELSGGRAAFASESTATIPCRTSAPSTTLLISTDGLGELNVVSIEYVLKFNTKVKRLEGCFR